MTHFYHDHASLEEFVRALAQASTYKSHDLGFEDSLSDYWKHEAEEWVKQLDADSETVPQVQIDGPQCKRCKAFTTQKRVDTHGLCMKCEQEKIRQ